MSLTNLQLDESEVVMKRMAPLMVRSTSSSSSSSSSTPLLREFSFLIGLIYLINFVKEVHRYDMSRRANMKIKNVSSHFEDC